MNTVHLVCEKVDLGYHVIKIFYNEDDANKYCEKLNNIRKEEYERTGGSYFAEHFVDTHVVN